jgi:CBS-domain-containing membrane protein
MKASDIMTLGVISADPDATVLQAARYMLQHHISGLPVIDKTAALETVIEGSWPWQRAAKDGAHGERDQC